MTKNLNSGAIINGVIIDAEPIVSHSRNGNGYLTPIVFDSHMFTLRHGYQRKKKQSYGTVSEQLISGFGLRPLHQFYAVMMGFPVNFISEDK